MQPSDSQNAGIANEHALRGPTVDDIVQASEARKPLDYSLFLTTDGNGRARSKPGVRKLLTYRDPGTGRRRVDMARLAQVAREGAL